jgi:hypothetical protein
VEEFQADTKGPAGGGHALHAAYEKVILPLDFHDLSAIDILVHNNAHAGSREIPDMTRHRHIRVAQNSRLARFICCKSVFRPLVVHISTSRFE